MLRSTAAFAYYLSPSPLFEPLKPMPVPRESQAPPYFCTGPSCAVESISRSCCHFLTSACWSFALYRHSLKGKRIGKIVPDNMVVVWKEPIQAEGSYDVPLQPTCPYWVLEYVSKSNKRKDYEKSFAKYEQHLQVPYYLLFYPDTQDLTLYHHNGQKYVSVPPNAQERHGLPDLELEVGLLDGWVRYWFRGELLPLPGDLQSTLDATRQQLTQQRQRAEEEKQRADQEKQRADQEKQRADNERETRLALEREVARLKAQMAQRPQGTN